MSGSNYRSDETILIYGGWGDRVTLYDEQTPMVIDPAPDNFLVYLEVEPGRKRPRLYDTSGHTARQGDSLRGNAT